MWVFGLATTIVMLSLWGRAVVSDQESLADSASSVVASGFVEERVEGWLGEVLVEATELGGDESASAASRIVSDPAVAAVIDGLARDLVAGALDPDAPEVRIDPDEVIAPVLSTVADVLSDEGVSIDTAALIATAAASPDVVLAAGALEETSSVVADSRAALSIAVVAGLVAMVLSGGTAVVMSGQRPRQLRLLATRILVSGLTFAVLLRLGAWAVDPSGGRSSVGALLSDQLWVPLLVAAIGAVLGAVAWSQRRAKGSPDTEPEPQVLVEV